MKKDRRKRPGPRAFSITQYALVFFLILSLVAVWLVLATLKETKTLKNQTLETQRKAALREIYIANTEITQIAERIALALTNWDEVRQQLIDPTFYAYWRASRALSAGKIPVALEGLDLYDKNGRLLLGSAKHGGAIMPPKILSSVKRPVVVKEKRDYLYYFFAIRADDNPASAVLGYGGIKLDYQNVLQGLRPLRYVDVNTISISGSLGEILDLKDVVSRAQFKLNRALEFESMEKIMIDSIYRISIVFGVFALGAYAMVTAFISLPLRQLARRIETLKDDPGSMLNIAYSGFLPVSELEQLRMSFNEYQARLDDMHLSLENKNKELWTLAHHDALTGVYNRRAFEEDWNRCVVRAAKQPTKMAFLLIDCDHFKLINDTYGHQTGDLVIQGIVQSVQSALRVKDRLYRLGGDEFATLLFDASLEDARGVAERFLEEVNQYDFASLGVIGPVHISVGLAYWPGTTIEKLLVLHKQADLAMYHAKKSGKAKLAVYSDALLTEASNLVSTKEISAFSDAIISSQRQLELHYQQVVRLPGCDVDYYEALVRIRHGDKLLLPADIFPVVEKRHIEIEFDLAVIEVIHAVLGQNAIPLGSGISVNLCASAIVSRKIIDRLLSLAVFLKKYKIVIEISESALLTQIKAASASLAQLRKTGYRVALDDFGRAYSSLRYLSHMPVDIIKFDISIMRGLQEQNPHTSFVRHLAELVADAGYELVAKGIENEVMLQRAIEIGFSHAQGNHLGRPQVF